MNDEERNILEKMVFLGSGRRGFNKMWFLKGQDCNRVFWFFCGTTQSKCLAPPFGMK